MILRILTASILVAVIAIVNAEARNEYLNDGANTCDQGSWEACDRDWETSKDY